jgi:hypothetical protein
MKTVGPVESLAARHAVVRVVQLTYIMLALMLALLHAAKPVVLIGSTRGLPLFFTVYSAYSKYPV